MLVPMTLAIVLLLGGAVLYAGAFFFGWEKEGFFGPLTASVLAVGTLIILALAVVELHFYKARTRDLERREERLHRAVNELEMEEETKASTLSGAFHDDFGGGLTALRMELELTQAAPDKPENWDRCYEKIDFLLNLARGVARTLYPKMVGQAGLTMVLREMGERLRQGKRFDVHYHFDGPLDSLPQSQALCVLRVVQESLVNVARHSNGKNVDIDIAMRGDRVKGCIRDDGTGRTECREGLGVTLMRERVVYLGGRLDIRLTPRGGVEVAFEFPSTTKAAAA